MLGISRFAVICVFMLGLSVRADISGFVRDENDQPIAMARVRIQTVVGEPVLTDASGFFTIPYNEGGFVKVTAAVVYDLDNDVQYLTAGVTVLNGATDVEIVLPTIPTDENTSYFPIKAVAPGGCADCHSRQYDEWLGSRHANTAMNTWVRDLYADFKAENPGNTGFCASCHAPAADSQDPGNVFLDEIDQLPDDDRTSAQEGVHCSGCHQIDHVNENTDGIHLVANASMRFPLSGLAGFETHEYVWGPLDDVDYTFMKAAYQPQFQESRYCASCHEYANPNNGLPAQTTYTEWANSPYALKNTPGYQSCQDCHMPRDPDPGPLCDPPNGFGNGPNRQAETHANHQIVGTDPQTMAAALDLQAESYWQDGLIGLRADLTNHGMGHDFPTGISLRNAVLLLDVRAGEVPLPFESGDQVPYFGSDDNGVLEDGDWAGLPGTAFGKVFADPAGRKPVLFIEAESIDYKKTVPAGETASSQALFSGSAIGSETAELTFSAELVYRRAYRATAVAKNWITDNQGLPWEFELKSADFTVPVWELAMTAWRREPLSVGLNVNGDAQLDVRDLVHWVGNVEQP